MGYFVLRLKLKTNIKMIVKNQQSADEVNNNLCTYDYETYIPRTKMCLF